MSRYKFGSVDPRRTQRLVAGNGAPVIKERRWKSSVLSLCHKETMQGMLKSIQGGGASNGTMNSGFVKCNVNVNRGSYIIIITRENTKLRMLNQCS